MSLKEELRNDMKKAMKEKEAGKLQLSVIRMALAAVKNTEIDKKHELSDEEVIEVIAREVKQRRDSIIEYNKAGRDDIVETINQEIDYLLVYLPQQLTIEEINCLVDEAIAATDAHSLKDIGKIMGWLMPRIKGKADGKKVNQIINEKLGA